ncbi:MAG TPA: phosphoglucosamine mutase [Oscillospiraceae bacterium]|nr:phosphoglucosamine mutase [Oscillospiraceae bacterium]
MGKLFGTDGIRGVANKELTPELAFRIGRIGAYLLQQKSKGHKAFLIARDTRVSGQMLEGALIAGITSAGVDVHVAGVISTPAAAYLTKQLNGCGGVMISASHNPYPDNGIKFFSAEGFKLPDEVEDEIEALYFQETDDLPRPEAAAIGRVFQDITAGERYLQYVLSTVSCRLDGYRVVLDCANGSAHNLAPQAFRALGAEVIACYDAPDGININHQCGSTHPEAVAAMVQMHQADFGFTFDGDADRVLAVDGHGQLLDGDVIMTILAQDLQEKGQLKHNTVVATVMSNLGLEKAAQAHGFELVRTNVGDRYVLEAMLAGDFSFGGEQSGHIILLQHNTTGDGLLTALLVAAVAAKKKQSFAELAAAYKRYPQVLVNCRVGRRDGWDKNPCIKEAVAQTEAQLAGVGRLLIRPSGTEPLIRVMLEGTNEAELLQLADDLVTVIQDELD